MDELQQGALDLVCAGRLSVDLYSEQPGSPIDRVESFRMYLGGSAANVCVGTSRLGLRTAMLARVGDDGWGTFLRRTLAEEGADTTMVARDPARLTAAVALAVRESDGFPRMFLYSDSADMATAVDDVDADVLSRARAVLVTGSFLTNPTVAATTHRVLDLAEAHDVRVVLDIDFRPALWGAAPLGQGQSMTAEVPAASAALAEVLPRCDLVVGTEEEILMAGGASDLDTARDRVRALARGAVVVKSGAQGNTVYPGPGEDDHEPVVVAGFPVEVFNSVGAGDAFLSGFLSAWLEGLPWRECGERGNACGALVVSRHGCSPAMPFLSEVEDFVRRDDVPFRVREDERLARLHEAALRRPTPSRLHVLAIDHRWQLEEMAADAGQPASRLPTLKSLLHQAFLRVVDAAPDPDGLALLCDDQYGAAALEAEAATSRWSFRALDVPRSRPVDLVCGPDAGAFLRTWAPGQTAKLMVWSHPDEDADVHAQQLARMAQVTAACRAAERELLLELQAPEPLTYGDGDLARLVTRAYEAGARPDWWKLPPVEDPAVWAEVAAVLERHDPACRGVLVLGQTAGWDTLVRAFAACADVPLVRGFAVGRAIFAPAAAAWLRGETDDDGLVDAVAERFKEAVDAWDGAHTSARAGAASA